MCIDWSHSNQYACTNKMNYDAFMPKQWPLITDISFIGPFSLSLSRSFSVCISTCRRRRRRRVPCVFRHATTTDTTNISSRTKTDLHDFGRFVYINNSSNTSLSHRINFKSFASICLSIAMAYGHWHYTWAFSVSYYYSDYVGNLE